MKQLATGELLSLMHKMEADYAALKAKADRLAEAVDVLARYTEDDAQVAVDGWDVGNSSIDVTDYAKLALAAYREGE